ncbi:MAG: molybdenum cofactor guanylyltransferase [Acidobacteria bacterium]|jgi:molybdopterin-guanine dinucleotide biosynthesis protein A|nr:molybdenum cofactor guanylyltransferase [Acidobacteriota bacterium]
MTREPLAAIILAGGRSRRMRREKPLLPICGRPLIETLVAQIRPCFETILVSAGAREKFTFLGLPIVEDESPGLGPLPAILTALRASPCRGNFVVACDIPFIDIPFLQAILALAPVHEIVVPRYGDGKFEPLFAAYDRAVIPAIERQLAGNDFRISSLFQACRTRFVPMDGQGWFRNLNTLEEYHDYIKDKKGPGS